MSKLETLAEVNAVSHELALESTPTDRPALERRSPEPDPPDEAFRLQANMRRGTGSGLSGTWSSYASIAYARQAAREMLRDDRVARVTVMTDTIPPQFVDWVNR